MRGAVRVIVPMQPVKNGRLFGSYANGVAKQDSDADVLVEFIKLKPITVLDLSNTLYLMRGEQH